MTQDINDLAARLGVDNPGEQFTTQCPKCDSPHSLHVGPGVDEAGNAKAYCFDPVCPIKDQYKLVAYLDGDEIDGPAEPGKYEFPTEEPLGWWAERCGVPPSFVVTLPLAATTEGALAFLFAGTDAVKTRPGAGDAPFGWDVDDKKRPPLWPVPGDSVPPAMLLTEGEGDATTMAYIIGRDGLSRLMSVHSVTKGADTEVPVRAWRELKRRGLEQVLVLFDEDKAGDAGAAKNIEAARSAGLSASRVHLDGIDPTLGEKDARDLWLRRLTLPQRDWDGNKVLRPYADMTLELAEVSMADLGARVLAELDDADAPDLEYTLIDPEGHTILFGQGDAGKGLLVATDTIARLTRDGKRCVIADFEDHPAEWRRRIARAGGDVTNVVIYKGEGALWDCADAIAELGRQFGAEYAFVDSISRAVPGPKDPYDPNTPRRYTEATTRTGMKVLSLAHIGRNDVLDYPFGSIGWHQQARTTWSIEEKAGTDDTHRAVIEHRKKQNRPWQGRYDVTVTFNNDRTITTTVERQVGAAPTITRSRAEDRAATLNAKIEAELARATGSEADAISKTALRALVGGNATTTGEAIDAAVEAGRIAVTLEGRYWTRSVPSRSGTDGTVEPTNEEEREPTQHSVRSGSRSDGSPPRERNGGTAEPIVTGQRS